LLTSARMISKQINDLENMKPYYHQHQKFTFSPDHLYLTLRFALLDYQNTATRHYEYQIDGLEDTWTACPGDILQLAGLPYGNFTLRVRAKLENGLFSSQQLAIPIEVRPPFYLRWWFLVLIFTCTILGIATFVPYRNQKIKGYKATPEDEGAVQTENVESYLKVPATLSPEEKKWLELLEKNVLEHLHNPDFTVHDLAKAVLVSRTLLYKEMERVLGLTPNGYINEIRLLKAMEILKNQPKELTIKKLANKVGYRDEKYFSQKFKQRFGILPSQMH
jgi:AraC-like DNA-binding protein